MITAETITDEQIREERLRCQVRFERGVLTKEDSEIHGLCIEASVGHMGLSMLGHEDYMAAMSARARLAELLNARVKEGK